MMLYFMLTGLFVAALFAASFAYSLKVHFKQDILPNVVQYMEYIADDIGDPPDLDKARRLSDGLSFELAIDGPGIAWVSHRRLQRQRGLEFQPAPPPFDDILLAHRKGRNFVRLERGGYSYTYVVGPLYRDRERRNLLLPVALLAVLGLLFVLIRSSLKPLQPIHGAVNAIGRGKFEPRLEPKGSTEFRELASGINAMARQIQQMLQAKQELLLAISHELRSPLTRARIHLELLAPGEERDAVISDMREMQQLVATLLESERLNQRHAVLHLERFDAAQSIERLLQTEFVAQRIDSDLSALTVEADPVRFELLIRNLLDNALKYSQSAPQPPQVRLRQDGESLLVEVEDFGIGMGA